MDEDKIESLIAEARLLADDLRERLVDEWKAARLYAQAILQLYRKGIATKEELDRANLARRLAAGRWGMVTTRQWKAIKAYEKEGRLP
jgi:hypothetical protein